MKNSIRTTIMQLTFASTVLIFASCNNSSRAEDTKKTAEDKNSERFEDRKKEKDAQFLINASLMNLEEIQLGQLAQQNGKTKEVKQLGQEMEEAHTEAQRDLTALAEFKNISIPITPTDDAMATYTMLNDKTGDSFDEAYTDKLVNRHKDAIKIFEKAADDCRDVDIKEWARNTLASLRTHLYHSQDCQKKYAKM
jgi:putative membrane protein